MLQCPLLRLSIPPLLNASHLSTSVVKVDYRFVLCLPLLHSFAFQIPSVAPLLYSAHNISTVDNFDLATVIVGSGQDELNSVFLDQIYATCGPDCS